MEKEYFSPPDEPQKVFQPELIPGMNAPKQDGRTLKNVTNPYRFDLSSGSVKLPFAPKIIDIF